VLTAAVDLILYLVFAGALFRLFQKAGIRYPWFAFLPVCSTIGVLRVIGRSGWNAFWMLVPIVNVILSIIWSVEFLRAYGKSGWWVLWAILPISDIVYAIMFLVWGYGSATEFKGRPPRKNNGSKAREVLARVGEKAREAGKDLDFYDNNLF
jgi:uncharacterized membrane protein